MYSVIAYINIDYRPPGGDLVYQISGNQSMCFPCHGRPTPFADLRAAFVAGYIQVTGVLDTLQPMLGEAMINSVIYTIPIARASLRYPGRFITVGVIDTAPRRYVSNAATCNAFQETQFVPVLKWTKLMSVMEPRCRTSLNDFSMTVMRWGRCGVAAQALSMSLHSLGHSKCMPS